MAKTKTPEATLPDTQALMAYAEVADEFKSKAQEVAEAEASIQPLRDELETVRAKVADAVEKMGGVDPFNLLKSSRGAKRGPRDPNKRISVLKAMTGKTVKEIVAESGQDRGYVQSVINSLKTKGELRTEGERPNTLYTFTGEVPSDES